ncbi:YihY/virulence factor BrkB family protein [Priestia filamentosa]|uniref:YihY/virulence factor BrkB family protein n=1 Tax=Priestia filamentosa TaxID=1402861 RepID=UPI001FB2E506|nr:YihY/virulence factor BrkB family protein [Priestia filamentosa]MED3727970.1 YihY/virulence factor BrkB family protein [Priestia filamentosa]UOE60159.1 YihY/virulence factor BrkB family protein [Priestia filamentosa]
MKKSVKHQPFIKEMFLRFHRDEVLNLSAELAYFLLLSLFPFLIFMFTLIAFLPFQGDDLLALVRQFAPEESLYLIEHNVQNVLSKQNTSLLSFGAIATVWSASNGINAIIRALNRAYNVKETRSFLIARAIAILLTIAMIFVIVIALLLPVFGKAIGVYFFSSFGASEEFLDVWNMLRWIVSIAILFIVFTFLYLFAPSKRLRLSQVVPGAIFTTVGWSFSSLAFSYYVNNFSNYSAMYGSLGGVIVLMIWLYLSGIILVLGGEVNGIYQERIEVED